jgi:hypothetical protein
MEKIKAFLIHIYGYFTDAQNEGDFMKIAGAVLMIVSVGRFAFGQGFDGVAFGSGAGAFATSKALDAVIVKKAGS